MNQLGTEPEYMRLLPASALRNIARFDLLARHAKEGFVVGKHKSPYKGFSAEFAEHRQYVAGDDTRHLDWRVMGRTDRYFIKQYEDETNLRTTILLDASGSMDYSGSKAVEVDGERLSKFEYSRRLAAVLTYLMVNQQDAVGLVTFDSRVQRYIPARARASHLRHILEELHQTRPGNESELAPVFHGIADRIRRRGLVVIISDLFDDAQSIIKALNHFCYRKHEVIVMHVMAEEELTFPFERWMAFRDLEMDDRRLQVDTGTIRSDYLERVQEFLRDILMACGRMKIDYVPFCTRESYDTVLANYLTQRYRHG